MKCFSRYYFSILLCLSSCLLFAQQKTVYVGAAGDNAADGLTAAHPLKTFAEAIKQLLPGDTLYLLPGVYHEKMVFDNKKGEAEKYIYIYGVPGKEKPVIDGGAAVPAMELENNWIEINKSAWIEFGDLSFINGWTDPIRVTNSAYISFRNCDIKGGRKVILGTGAETHHLLVEGCTWDQGGEALWTLEKDARGVDGWLSMHHELMGYFNGTLVDSRASGGSFVIRNNRISNAYNGIRLTSKKGYDANIEVYNNTLNNIRDNDFEPEHYAFNLHIYHNRSHNIHKTLSVDDVAGGYIYYYGNTISMDADEWSKKICSGFNKIYGGEDSLSFPLYIFNNSFFGYGKNFNAMEKKARQLKHFNNAYFFAGADGWVLKYVDPTNAFENDLSNKPWPQSLVEHNMEQQGKIADVRYVNSAKGDLHINSNSPAKDAGRIMSFPELGWTQAYKGKAPDIGAYENNDLVEGPPFRFRLPDSAKFSYKERPRIVRYRAEGKKLFIYFSDQINTSSVTPLTILLGSHGRRIAVFDASFPNSKYELVIETKTKIDPATIAIGFQSLPRGMNGMPVTYWASVLPVFTRPSTD